MSFIPNRNARGLKVAAANDYPGWPPLDTLYDYTSVLHVDLPLGTVPAQPPLPVVIIGAGIAGLVAAYELLRIGIVPVVLEASDRIGGRNYTLDFPGSTTSSIAEMGAMRVPPSARVFQYYANLFNLQQGVFPDPGKVPTTIYYENEVYQWNFGGSGYPNPTAPNPPGQFNTLETAWNDFVNVFVNDLNSAWAQGPQAYQTLWQSYIDRYGQMSFYEALVQGIPSWTEADLEAFGALGIGSGGFGPLYSVNFLELLRIILNQWETGQQLILGLPDQNIYGIHALAESFYTAEVMLNNQPVSLQSLDAVALNVPVTNISVNTAQDTVQVTFNNLNSNIPTTLNCSALIVATTTRSMQIMGLTLPSPPVTPGGPQLLSEEARSGLRDLHMMSSSKLFVRTPTKFWANNNNISWNIQTDEMVRGVYTLDYPWTTDGVVLISYTWGDDSDKLLALPPVERYAIFWNIINAIDPVFASFIQPATIAEEDILVIDWQAEPNYYGAFKLDLPGQEPEMHDAYYQFLSVLTPATDSGVYLAGDGVSWSGGWTEGALETGLNAVCAVVQHLGGTVVDNSPLTQNPAMFNYGSSS